MDGQNMVEEQKGLSDNGGLMNTNVIIGLASFFGGAFLSGGSLASTKNKVGAAICTGGLLLIAATYMGLVPTIGSSTKKTEPKATA